MMCMILCHWFWGNPGEHVVMYKLGEHVTKLTSTNMYTKSDFYNTHALQWSQKMKILICKLGFPKTSHTLPQSKIVSPKNIRLQRFDRLIDCCM